MTDLLHALQSVLYEAWPVLVGGFVVVFALFALARVGQTALALSLGSGPGAADAVVGLASVALLGLFALTAADDLARAAMLGLGCDVGFAQDLLQAALQVLYGLMAVRLLLAGYRGLAAAATGGSGLTSMALEAGAVLASSLTLPFLAAFAGRFFGC